MKSWSQIANPKLILTLNAYSCLFRNIFYESSFLLVQTVSGSLMPKALSLSCETRGGFTWLHSDILPTRIGRPPKNWRKKHLLQLSHEKPVQFTETWHQRWILSTKGTSLSHTEPAFPCFSQLMLVYHCSPEMLAASFISWVWSPSSVLASGSQTPAGTGTVPEELDGASSHILMRFKGLTWPPLTGCQCRWCILKVYQTQCALSTVGACQTWCFIICIFS